MPPEVLLSLSRMISALNRKQFEDGIAASSNEFDVDARGVELDDQWQSNDALRTSSRPVFLTPNSVESSELGSPKAALSLDTSLDEKTADDGEEAEGSWGDGIPSF